VVGKYTGHVPFTIIIAIKPRYLGNHASQKNRYYGTLFIQKTYQFINVVNGMSRSHKTANIFLSIDSVA